VRVGRPRPGKLTVNAAAMSVALFDPGPIDPLQLHSKSGPTPAKKATATVWPFAKEA
jgi:hypothetical protein